MCIRDRVSSTRAVKLQKVGVISFVLGHRHQKIARPGGGMHGKRKIYFYLCFFVFLLCVFDLFFRFRVCCLGFKV